MDGEWLRKNRFLSIERKDSMRKTSSSFKKPYVILNCLTRFQIFRSSWITGNTERQKLRHRQKLTAVSIWYAQLISSPRDGPRVWASLALTSCETHPRSSGPLKAFTALSFTRLNASTQHSCYFPAVIFSMTSLPDRQEMPISELTLGSGWQEQMSPSLPIYAGKKCHGEMTLCSMNQPDTTERASLSHWKIS